MNTEVLDSDTVLERFDHVIGQWGFQPTHRSHDGWAFLQRGRQWDDLGPETLPGVTVLTVTWDFPVNHLSESVAETRAYSNAR
jgi:hypothetical protein